MEENGGIDVQVKVRRVRVPWLPTYRELRRLLSVWPGHSKTQITGLERTLEQLSGTPQKPVNWKDPDRWIPERLTGEDRKLADKIWAESGRTVNPRHTAGSWNLARTYMLLAEGSDGNLELSERGRDFIEHRFGRTERFLDEREGLFELLGIVADAGPARSGVLAVPWAEFLKRASRYRADSTIRDTLSRRLTNLVDRDLASREHFNYAITEAGREYLERVGPLPPPPGNGKTMLGFKDLAKSLRNDGLLFSFELVANYILALQAKRFAILTGISGTGKTRIARAVAQHFAPLLKKRVARAPTDAVEVEVKPSHIKYSRVVLPVAIASQLSISTGDDDADRELSIRYPAGHTTLRYYAWGSGASKAQVILLFRGEFRKWFHSTVDLGDRFWLRVRPGETADSDELEMGVSETEVVEQPGDNYVVIPVRPDWVDNRGLLGYLNPLTDEYSTTPFLNLLLRAREEEQRAEAAGEKPHPFFIILDEMNLARVEHYFSDFLSALESGEDIPLHESETIESGESESSSQIPRRLKVPGNVLFTGTVNVDETTYMFSPKVLDRAFTIEFDQVDLEGFTKGESGDDTTGLNLDGEQTSLDLLPSSSSGGDDWKPSREDWVKFSEDSNGHQKALLKLHDLLATQHRHFGYRVANEIARFVNLARAQAADADAAGDAAFDLALLQKVLPKFHGTQQELESLLKEIFHFAVFGGDSKPRSQLVDSDDWEVIAGRLVAKAKPPTPSGDGGSQAAETGSSEASEKGTDDAEPPSAPAQSPAYPRTGAKVLRMLRRLRDRGFTSFIE